MIGIGTGPTSISVLNGSASAAAIIAALFRGNKPGFDFDFNDALTAFGWRKNLLTQTENFAHANWGKTRATVDHGVATGPNGLVVSKLISAANYGSHFISQAATARTISLVAKAGEYSHLKLTTNAYGSTFPGTYFNLVNGTIGSRGTGQTATMEHIGDGFYLCSITQDTEFTGAYIETATANATSQHTGDGVSGIYISAAQAELGDTATEYQPITTVDEARRLHNPDATIFTDNLGTTPVEKPTDTIGLVLDKRLWGGKRLSQVLAGQPELTTGGGFDNPADWTTTATVSIENSSLVASGVSGTSGDSAYQSIGETFEAGQLYAITFTLAAAITSGSGLYARIRYGALVQIAPVGTSAGTHTSYVVAGDNTNHQIYLNPRSDLVLENVSVKHIPGNHASQATHAKRPIWAVKPKTGRRNLLVYSEQFDNAAWAMSATQVTATANTGIAPDGSYTADTLHVPADGSNKWRRQNLASAITATLTASVYVKAAPTGSATHIRLTTNNGAAWSTGGSTKVALTDEWQRIEVTWSQSGSGFAAIMIGNVTADASGADADCTGNVLVWGGQCEVGSTATAYQKVVSDREVYEEGVPLRGVSYWDGVQHSLQTGAIDFTATDEMTVFAGVRKLSGANGMVVELSANANTQNGAFRLTPGNNGSGGGPYYSAASRGSTLAQAETLDSFMAPVTNVVTAVFDISNDIVLIRADGVEAARATAAQGTVNYGNHVLNIGSRAASTLFAHMEASRLTGVGASQTDATLAKVESIIADLTPAAELVA